MIYIITFFYINYSDRKLTRNGLKYIVSNAAHHWIFFSVELTSALSLTLLLSNLGSNICKTQDHSHSDTTPLYYINIYLHMEGHGEKFQGEKLSIYKWVICCFPSRQSIIFNSFFTKIFVSKMVSKFLPKISVKKNY